MLGVRKSRSDQETSNKICFLCCNKSRIAIDNHPCYKKMQRKISEHRKVASNKTLVNNEHGKKGSSNTKKGKTRSEESDTDSDDDAREQHKLKIRNCTSHFLQVGQHSTDLISNGL